MIPERFRTVYPTPPLAARGGAPVMVFRGHRWTVPALFLAAEQGLVTLPVPVVTFDRHRDSLRPMEMERLFRFRSHATADEAVFLAGRLSPRNDDWIIAGMEMGIVSNAVQFRSAPDDLEPVTLHTDGAGALHRIHHLGMPGSELAYKGALADPERLAEPGGPAAIMGWNPETGEIARKPGGLALDIDLDFFTVAWETYILPFTEDIFRGEFLEPRQSGFLDSFTPKELFRGLVGAAGAITIACEPEFCGGGMNSRRILEEVNLHLFEGVLDTGLVGEETTGETPTP
jgi:hypothetical protein